MSNEQVLGTKKIWKLCIMMGLPCVLAQLVNLLYNIVDRIYIGNMAIVGANALAGLGLCAPIITLISAFASFVGGGGAPLAAKALGEGDKEKAHRILGNGFSLLIIFSLVLMILFYGIKKPLLYAIGASSNTFFYADDYLSIYLIGTFFVLISVGLNTFITAQGKSTIAMISVLIGAILNIILDPLFIFVFDLGTKGAAIATILSQMASASFVLGFLFSKKATLRIRIVYMKLNPTILLGILALGVSPFVMSATESLIGFVLNKGLQDYGGDIYVSLLTVLQSVMMLVSVPITGFTQGVTPIISYNFGAKNIGRLKEAVKLNLLVCFFFTSIFTVIVMVFPKSFGMMFSKDQELISLCGKYLPIFMAGMLIFGIQRACQTAFIALSEAKISLFIALLSKVILLVPLALILPIYFGVSGIYYAEPIADVLAAITCGLLFLFRFKSIIAKID